MPGIFIKNQCIIFEKFYHSGAINAECAVSPECADVKRNMMFEQLVNMDWIFKLNNEEKYYLNLAKIKTRPVAWEAIMNLK